MSPVWRIAICVLGLTQGWRATAGAQEYVTCWTKTCPDMASWVKPCPATRAPKQERREPSRTEKKPHDAAQAVLPPTTPAGMVLIPGGAFWMGSNDGEANEKPVTQVTLSPYYLDRTEVTVADFARCVRAGKCTWSDTVSVNLWISEDDVPKLSKACNWGRPGHENHPINCVDWTQAKAYCEWRGGRLPTEAEWEYGARGKDGRKYPWGDAAPDAIKANACGTECRAWWKRGDHPYSVMYEAADGWPTTAPVGSFSAGASPFGLQDMAGNVAEWVEDAFAVNADGSVTKYAGGSISDPLQKTGQYRLIRGGGWRDYRAAMLRGANRNGSDPADRNSDVGFRCARGASASSPEGEETGRCGATPAGMAAVVAAADVDTLIDQAGQCLEQKNASKALEFYDRALNVKPTLFDAVYGRGLALYDLGRTDDAIAAFKAALQLDHQHKLFGEAMIGLAETYKRQKNNKEAVKYYREYLEMYPTGEQAAVARANVDALK